MRRWSSESRINAVFFNDTATTEISTAPTAVWICCAKRLSNVSFIASLT